MKKNKLKKIFAVLTVFILGSSLFAKEITLGGKAGWPVFQSSENITTGKGRYGYDCIQLATNSFKYDDYTDLLINFENQNNLIADGDYDVVQNNMKYTKQSIMAKGAGLSRNIGGMKIIGNPGTFFGSEGLQGSFSIEFWLCPSLSENGETIMNWESSKNVVGRLVYQLLNCSFNGGKLEWTLSNIFDSYMGKSTYTEVHMKGQKNIVPDTWSYHALSYDCETGVLEYLVNGETEDIKYITSTGREGGEVGLVVLGRRSEVSFCSEYTGKIDDIRILRRPYDVPDYQSAESAGKISRMLYNPTGGRFVTKPMVVSTGSILTSIEAETTIPSQTDICFYVRSGDNYFNWTDNYPAWKPVENKQQLKGISGMYFQLACDIYPDGDGAVTPSVTSIKLNFEELPLPLPPFTVKAIAGNGCVTLNWNYSVDDTTGGYYVYYGTRPGEYLGRYAFEGDSPVKVGNVSSFKITGLENGKIYYFAIASWSSRDERIIGPLSKEVFARPLDRLSK